MSRQIVASDEIKLIEDNYELIFDDLKRFDAYKDHYDPKKIVPNYYRKGMRIFEIVNNQEKTHYCSDISGLIQLFLQERGIKCKVVYGYFKGYGARFNRGLWDATNRRQHAWVELGDGTIIDGAFRQFNSPKTKIENLKLLNIVKKSDTNFKDYQKEDFMGEPELTALPYIVNAKNNPYDLNNSFWWKRNSKARSKK